MGAVSKAEMPLYPATAHAPSEPPVAGRAAPVKMLLFVGLVRHPANSLA